jgi:hypothetical protein
LALQPAVTIAVLAQRRRYTGQEKDAAVRLVLDTGRAHAVIAQQLGIGERALTARVRAERMQRRGQDWLNRVRPYIDFLRDYGFEQVEVQADRWWRVRAISRSAVNAVAVDYSVETDRVELFLIELADGELLDVQGADAAWLLRLGQHRSRRRKDCLTRRSKRDLRSGPTRSRTTRRATSPATCPCCGTLETRSSDALDVGTGHLAQANGAESALLDWAGLFVPEVLGWVKTRRRRPRSGLVLTRPVFSGSPCVA